MAKSPPAFKRSSSAKTDNGSAMPFSDAKIKGARVIPTAHPSSLRTSFTKKLYTTQCGKGDLPGQDKILKKS
jgi:hypothetical protein